MTSIQVAASCRPSDFAEVHILREGCTGHFRLCIGLLRVRVLVLAELSVLSSGFYCIRLGREEVRKKVG